MKYDVFLSGPMSGIEDYNRPAFNEAAAQIRALGLTVFNPAEIDGGDTSQPRAYYMRRCLRELLEHSDALVSLPRWSGSKGAHLERHVAMEIGLPCYNLAAFLRERST